MQNKESVYLDDRDALRKIADLDVGAIHGGNVVDAATSALKAAKTANDIAGLAGKGINIPRSTTIGAVLTGARAYYDNEAYLEKATYYFKAANIRQLMRQNPALRRIKQDVNWVGMAGEMGASIGGGMLGAAGGTAIATLLPFTLPALPFVMLATSAAGGYVANRMYNAAFVKQEQDPIIINMQIVKMREAGEVIPPEVVFAGLAANLRGKSGEYAEKLLEKYTGTKLFTVALSDPANIKKLTAMMHDPGINNALGAETGMPVDNNNPYKSVAEQYAQMINNGQMDPRNMLNRFEGLYSLKRLDRGDSSNLDVPVTPEMRQNFIGKNI